MEEKYIVFDTETPNRRNDRMCSIGICVVERGRIIEEQYELVEPEETFDDFHVGLHGISPELVRGKPTFAALWEKLRPWMEGGILVAHNAQFDMAVLAKCLAHYQIHWRSRVPYACTCRMGRACYPEAPNHKLDTLCRLLGIELDHHNAASDSRACAQLLLSYLERGWKVHSFSRVYDMERIATVKR